MSQETKKRGRTMGWDPRSPATLWIPSGSSKEDFRVDAFLSHDGIGCNPHEASAIMELLDARDAYLQSEVGNAGAVRSVSRAYRKALADCVEGWESELMDQDDAQQEGNLELLKTAYAVTHLSETFLLAPNSDFIMDHYENVARLPGAVTADTVRYLRLHHMADPLAAYDDAVLDTLENSVQPDQLDGGAPFWNLVEKHLVRGCLEDAWALLSRHSLQRQAMDTLEQNGLNEYQAATLVQDQDGFKALEAVLLSAPIPGGRTDEFDAAFVLGDEENFEEGLLEGIPPAAFRLWESSKNDRDAGDFPSSFQSNAAMQVYESWQQAVKGLPEIQALRRRIPQLQRVISILTGDFSGVEFDNWAEELCAEILYKMPSIRLGDIHVRASKIMSKYEADELTECLNGVVVSIMKGNAGRVIEVLHELGGGSGAALPAVMASLLCNLLDDVHVLPKISEEYSMATELLLAAAFSIRSSFSMENQDDIGVRLVVRLLLPHIKVGGELRITAEMVDAMEHHSSKTDAEAETLLALCRGLVERKNIRVLDGCVSLVLARYQRLLNDGRPGGAAHWLLVGMDLESLCFEKPKEPACRAKYLSTSVCHRMLSTLCAETSERMLKGMLGEGEGVSLQYVKGKEIIATCDESKYAELVPAAKVLGHIVTMAETIVERKNDALIAASIIACLEENSDGDGGGGVSCLARSTMHWDLLRLAKGLLERNEEKEAGEELHLFTAAFDVRGMQVLLEKLTLILATAEMQMEEPLPAADVKKMRSAFAEGLMHAFVAENATKKLSFRSAPRVSVAGICAADLGKVSREKQELVVQNMLDF